MRFSRFITLLCLLGTCIGAVRATDVVLIGEIYYILDNTHGTATVTNRPISDEYDEESWMYYQPNELYTGSLVIPDSVVYGQRTYAVTSIGDYAMANCRLLTSIHFPKGLQQIGLSAFALCYNIATISIDPSNPVYIIIDGILYTRQPMRIRFVPYALSGEVVVDNGVTEIYSECFKLCKNITSIVLPDHITTIEDGAFNECSGLRTIHLPASLQSIQRYAFFKCGLQQITLPAGLQQIEASAFLNCTNLKTVYNGSSLNIVAGSDSYGHVAYYADQVIQEVPSNLPSEPSGSVPTKMFQNGRLVIQTEKGIYSASGMLLSH